MGQSLDYEVRRGEPLLNISLKENDFFPGEIIRGNIFLKSWNLLKKGVINYMIFNKEYYFYNNESKNIKLEQKKLNNIFIKSLTYKEIIDYSLSEGISIPFSILLPKDIFPNFEYCLRKVNVYIRYYLQIEIPELNLIKQKLFIVKKPFKLLESPLSFNITDNFGLLDLYKKENISFNASYKKNCYEFYDKIPIEINITTNSNKNIDITKIKIKLLRKIILKNDLEFCDILFNNEMIINEKTDKNNNDLIINTDIYLEEPESLFNKYKLESPYLNSSYISDKSALIKLIPDINSNLIKCEYKIQIYFSYNTFFKKKEDLLLIMPISVCHKKKIFNNELNSKNILIYDKRKDTLKQYEDKIKLLLKQKENCLNQIEKKEEENNKKENDINEIRENNIYTNNGNNFLNTPTNVGLLTKVD